MEYSRWTTRCQARSPTSVPGPTGPARCDSALGAVRGQAAMLERPPELDEPARVAQGRRGRGLEAAETVAQRVRVHVQRLRGVLDAHLVVEPGAQRRLELRAQPAEPGQRLQVARGERLAERVVG